MSLQDAVNAELDGRSRNRLSKSLQERHQNQAQWFENSDDDNEYDSTNDSDADEKEKNNVTSTGRKRGRPRIIPEKAPEREVKRRGRPRDESKRDVPCDICGKIFKYLYQLKTHHKLHFGIKDFECEHCHLRFVQKGALVVHLRKHTGEKPFKCPYCPEAFKEKISLDNHVFKHTQQGTKCPQCPAVFATPYAVKQHVKQVHSQERPNVCQICGKSYKNRREMLRHIEGHERRICSVCDKVFDTMYALKTHMHVHAEGPKCSFCNRLFKSEEELQAHSKLRGRAYQCELCCYSFNKAEFLSNHHRRNHWKVLGLEQLVWNFPPRPKKPKPAKKVKAPLPIVQVTPIQENAQPTQLQRSEAMREVSVVKTDPMITNETKQEIVEKQSDFDDYSFHNAPDSVLGSDAIDQTKSDIDVKIKVESQAFPEEVFVKEEDGSELEVTQQGDLIEFELDELDVKTEDSSHDEEDDIPLAILRLKFSRMGKLASAADCNFEDSADSNEDKRNEKTVRKIGQSTLENEKILQNSEKSNDTKTDLWCDICQKLFKTRSHLKIHQRIHIGIKNFSCEICHKSFLRKGTLVVHLRTHSEEKTFQCSHCPERFKTKYLLDFHILKHTKQGVQCDLCPKVLPSQSSFRIHLKASHIKRESFRCHLCGKRYRRSDSLKGHLKTHEDQTCKVCGEICKGREALKKHRKTVHRVKKKSAPLICELCGQKYSTVTSLSVHRAKHKEYQRFKCDQCPKVFFFSGMLDDHQRVEHQGERLICPVCGKLFKYPSDLGRHQVQHTNEKPYKCDQCPATYRHSDGLRCHKAMHKKTVYTCNICSKEYRSINGLRVHKKLHIVGSRFECEICNHKFNQKAPLLRHMTIHTAERQLKCAVCDHIFYKKVDLAIHQAKQHPNHPLIGKTIKVHTCSICGADFTKRHLLEQHIYIHGNEYKFKCDMCKDQKFKQKAGLRHHWKYFHRIEPPKRKAVKKIDNKADDANDTELITPLYEEIDDQFESVM